MEAPLLSARARRRLLLAALLGAGGYTAYRIWRDEARVRKAVHNTVAELQRRGEAALTRATACVVAGTVRGVAAVRPQAVEAPAPREPWQAMALEKLLSLLTSRAGMDLVSLAVAVGAQHSVAAFCQHWTAQQAAVARAPAAAAGHPNGHGGGAMAPPPLEQPIGNPIVAQLLSWAGTPQGERFVVSAMAAAARNSTRAYMDCLGAGNSWDDIFSAAFRPENRAVLKDLTVLATREAVSTYLCPVARHGLGEATAAVARTQRRRAAEERTWSDTLKTVGQGTASLMKQVSTNSRAAAVAIPVLLFASSRGLALGCKDAITRTRLDNTELLPVAGRIIMTDSALRLLWVLLVLAATVLMAFFGIRTFVWRDSVLTLHA